MATIDYYFATISPFSYLAGMRLEEVAARHGAQINYKPLDIMALFARTGGVSPKDRHPSRAEYRLQEMRRQSDSTGLDLKLKPAHWPTNAAPSSYAIIAAQAAGGGDVGLLAHSILRTCWSEEKNIAEDDVIRGCLNEAGFDSELANSGLLSGAETYSRNLEDAVNAGVFGAPFYVVGDERYWGQDRLADLDRYLSTV
ncbi:MAG: 2-hydroxychromene-2-carboxylate isomerase [Pseudoruegeria sp.]